MQLSAPMRVLGAALVAAIVTPSTATPVTAEVEQGYAMEARLVPGQDRFVFARQDQGIGGDASKQPPGVPVNPDIPFAGNE